MKIQAINAVNSMVGCQPIKQVGFTKKKAPVDSDKKGKDKVDSFEAQDSKVLNEKYNLACRLAAYYKLSYENLLKKGECLV